MIRKPTAPLPTILEGYGSYGVMSVSPNSPLTTARGKLSFIAEISAMS